MSSLADYRNFINTMLDAADTKQALVDAGVSVRAATLTAGSNGVNARKSLPVPSVRKPVAKH